MDDNLPSQGPRVEKAIAQDQANQNNGIARDIARTIINSFSVWHHSRGHLGRHGSVYHAPRSSIAMTRCILMSSRSSNSAQTATHYINVTTIQTGADILWDYAGRYQDAIWNNTGPGPEGRTLDGISFNWTGNMTNELCADACAGYQYFGTEFCERQACPLHNFLERVKYGGMQKLILCGCRFAVLLWK
jgi:hypothetical protein